MLIELVFGRYGVRYGQVPHNTLAEAGLLCARAARYPGTELRWNKGSFRFTNHDEATKTLVRREYRPGFELPEITSS